MLKENKCKADTLYLVKGSFKIEGKIKVFFTQTKTRNDSLIIKRCSTHMFKIDEVKIGTKEEIREIHN